MIDMKKMYFIKSGSVFLV